MMLGHGQSTSAKPAEPPGVAVLVRTTAHGAAVGDCHRLLHHARRCSVTMTVGAPIAQRFRRPHRCLELGGFEGSAGFRTLSLVHDSFSTGAGGEVPTRAIGNRQSRERRA